MAGKSSPFRTSATFGMRARAESFIADLLLQKLNQESQA